MSMITDIVLKGSVEVFPTSTRIIQVKCLHENTLFVQPISIVVFKNLINPKALHIHYSINSSCLLNERISLCV